MEVAQGKTWPAETLLQVILCFSQLSIKLIFRSCPLPYRQGNHFVMNFWTIMHHWAWNLQTNFAICFWSVPVLCLLTFLLVVFCFVLFLVGVLFCFHNSSLNKYNFHGASEPSVLPFRYKQRLHIFNRCLVVQCSCFCCCLFACLYLNVLVMYRASRHKFESQSVLLWLR